MELSNGCICCTMRGDLLREVTRLARAGAFDYLLIESTGVSEPMQVRLHPSERSCCPSSFRCCNRQLNVLALGGQCHGAACLRGCAGRVSTCLCIRHNAWLQKITIHSSCPALIHLLISI